MKSSVSELLAAVKTMAVASDIALNVKRDKVADSMFYQSLKQIDELIDDLRQALEEFE